jgi:rhodanese-related sulfurtransferase
MSQPNGCPAPPNRQTTPSRITRRGLVVGGAVVGGVGLLMLGAIGSVRWFNVSAQVSGGDLSVSDALRAVQSGEITLVDIRRPDEWNATGVAKGAVPIDMRRDDFIDLLLAKTDGDTSAPVALICARGVRSARMSSRLKAAGFTRIIDVPEGMLGSGAGPGWLKSGLPVVQP